MTGAYPQLEFPKLDDRPYVICNMVMTADGKATINDQAHEIGDAHDHASMQQLRLHADATMSGAGTLVKEDIIPFVDEQYQQLREQEGKPKFPRAMTLTDRPDLPTDRKFYQAEYRPTIYTTGGKGQLSDQAEVYEVAGIKEMLEHAKRELGVDLLCQEGGPRLNGQMMAHGLIDELFVTLAPKISGLSGISIVEGDKFLGKPLKLLSVSQINDELFLRYKVQA